MAFEGSTRGKKGKETHKKVACCVLGGLSRADLYGVKKRGSGEVERVDFAEVFKSRFTDVET
jgi:hypothetical protein